MNEEFLDELRHKKEVHRGWKQGQYLGRSAEILSKQPGIRLGKLKT